MSRDPTPVFSGRAIAWAVGLTLGSFLLLFLWSGLGDDMGEPATAGANSYSYSALGHRAFATLLSRTGVRVERQRTPHPAGPDVHTALLLADPLPESGFYPERAAARRRAIRAAASQGAPVLIVLPKRLGGEDARHPGWVDPVARWTPDSVLAVARPLGLTGLRLTQRAAGDTASCRTSDGATRKISIPFLQLLEPVPGLTAVVTCDSAILVGRYRLAPDSAADAGAAPPPVYVVADPDLINNYGIGRAENAEVVISLLTRDLDAHTVRFDETLHLPMRAPGIARELLRFPLVLAVAQAFLLLGAFGWAGVARFGTMRPAAARDASNRALVESIAGLLAGGGRPAELLQTYFGQVLREVGERYGLAATFNRTRLVETLARIARSRGVAFDITELAAQVDRLPLAAGRQTPAVLRAARDIHRWHQEMNDDR